MEDREGRVVTFYSYKGGVGRTFTLVNVAATLAEWGFKVLCIDWDLEAPGLTYFLTKESSRYTGLVEMMQAISNGDLPRWRQRIHDTDFQSGRNFKFIPAGKSDGSYSEKLQSLNWSELYSKRGLGEFLEEFRKELKKEFDFVLIDSRTGISDTAGICTAQLPDLLVCVFTANYQSVAGAMDVVSRARVARSALPFDRANLRVLPVASKIDLAAEYRLVEKWKDEFAARCRHVLGEWLPESASAEQMMDLCIIPYSSRWSFGEDVAVNIETRRTIDYVSYYVENIASIVANSFTRIDLLLESRENYIDLAKREAIRSLSGFQYDFFLSYSPHDRVFAAKLREALLSLGASVTEFDGAAARASVGDRLELRRHLSRARHFILVVPERLDRQTEFELYTFMREALDERSGRAVIPVIREGRKPISLPSIIKRVQYFGADEDDIGKTAAALVSVGRRLRDR